MKRLLILLLALVTMTALPGQPGMLLVGDAAAPPPPAQLLLDQYPEASAAYSFRLLRSNYTGNCVEVRRAFDNQTSNIGFSGGVIDTVSLKSFCAATDCFVRTWYDQSTNVRNAVQTTAANQPQIVSNGAVIYQGARVALKFTTSPITGLTVNASGLETSSAICGFYSYASTAAAAANTPTAVPWGHGLLNSSSRGLLHASSTGLLTGETMYFDVRETAFGQARIGSSSYTRSANTSVVESVFFLSSGVTFVQNNSAISLNLSVDQGSTTKNYTGTGPYGSLPNPLTVGCFYLSSIALSANQNITEMIFYPTDQSTNRAAITSNLITYYN